MHPVAVTVSGRARSSQRISGGGTRQERGEKTQVQLRSQPRVEHWILAIKIAMARLPRFALVACATAVASGCSSAAWGPDQCVFAPHMVLASSDAWRSGVTPARVWGNAAPGEVLTLSGLPDGAVVTPSNPWKAAADGTWTIQIEALASLTPSNLTFSGSSKMSTTLTDILFGHTYVSPDGLLG